MRAGTSGVRPDTGNVLYNACFEILERVPFDEMAMHAARPMAVIVPAMLVDGRGLEALLEQTAELYEMTSERMASSVARPPAFRITWASPSARPAYLAGSRRASMQVKMANSLPGAGQACFYRRTPRHKAAFAFKTLERTDMIGLLELMHDPIYKSVSL
jgi:hypothetical protein